MNIHPGILVKKALDKRIAKSRSSLETLRLQTGFNKELFYGICAGQLDMTVNRARKLVKVDPLLSIEELMKLQAEYNEGE